MRGRLTGLVAVAATAALAIGAGTAIAGTSSTSVSIEAQSIGFFGYVHSSKSSCESGRRVKLYKVKRHAKDPKVGSDIAQPNGPDSMWSINTDLSGKFYAKVPATDKCDKAVSDTVHSE
jgi:hypothetical protein